MVGSKSSSGSVGLDLEWIRCSYVSASICYSKWTVCLVSLLLSGAGPLLQQVWLLTPGRTHLPTPLLHLLLWASLWWRKDFKYFKVLIVVRATQEFKGFKAESRNKRVCTKKKCFATMGHFGLVCLGALNSSLQAFPVKTSWTTARSSRSWKPS